MAQTTDIQQINNPGQLKCMCCRQSAASVCVTIRDGMLDVHVSVCLECSKLGPGALVESIKR
jgi:hypothetical protein